jgi:NACalpha-BTF3-like transcription factor
MVTPKREIWVRIYGFPLHVWGEKAFRLFTKQWGVYVGLDEETRSRSRFDVARVKILSSTTVTIDTVRNITVQDTSFVVRVIEEGGGPLEFVHYTKEEDQIGWSAAGSSCDSVVRGPAVAVMMDGGVSDGFDSDESKETQDENTELVKTLHGDKEDITLVMSKTKVTLSKPVLGFSNPSKATEQKTKDEDNNTQVVLVEGSERRGLSTSICGDQRRAAEVERKVDQKVGSPDVGSLVVKRDFLKSNGPLSAIPLASGSGHGGFSPLSKVGQEFSDQVVADPGVKIVEKLDELLMVTRGNILEKGGTDVRQVVSSLSPSISIPVIAKHRQKVIAPHRKPPARVPFPQIGGPKCLRFVEEIQGGGPNLRRKNVNSRVMVDKGGINFTENLESESITSSEDDRQKLEEQVVHSNEEIPKSPEAIHLEVVLPLEKSTCQQSGLNWLMGEEDLNDVDAYEVRRRNSETKRMEAEELLQIQQDFGVTCDRKEQNSVARLMEHEDSDREKFEDCEELLGNQ